MFAVAAFDEPEEQNLLAAQVRHETDFWTKFSLILS